MAARSVAAAPADLPVAASAVPQPPPSSQSIAPQPPAAESEPRDSFSSSSSSSLSRPDGPDPVPTIQVQPDSPTLSRRQTEKTTSLPSTEEIKGPDGVSGDGRSGAAKEKEGGIRHDAKPARATQFVQVDPTASSNDKTTVDIVTVPCPGADPHETWTRDALLENYFGTSTWPGESGLNAMGVQLMRTSIVSPAIHRVPPKAVPSWVRQGIRREANQARILMYCHQTPIEGTTLNKLANDLLQQLLELRGDGHSSRPIFFIGHSIGGLVVKLALTKASHNRIYESILNDCYGVAFFATPHRGSSYLSMRNLAGSIQKLLDLSVPLPRSIIDDLRVGHRPLVHIDDDFKALSSDMHIWSFYETVDSRLSGGTGAVGPRDVYFSAPVTAIKSAILNVRQETIFPLQSDHAKCASFGRNNTQTLELFLKDLAAHVRRAHEHATERAHTAMNLEQKVRVEVHGFYEDPTEVGAAERTVRAWSTKLPLRDFLIKGPNQCLEDRLNDISGGPRDNQFLGFRPRATSLFRTGDSTLTTATRNEPGRGQNLLGIGIRLSQNLEPVQHSHSFSERQRSDDTPQSPNIVLTDPFDQPARPTTPNTRATPLSQKVTVSGAAAAAARSLHPDHASKPSPFRTPSFGRSASENSPLAFDGAGGFQLSPRSSESRRFSEAFGMEGNGGTVPEEDGARGEGEERQQGRTTSAATSRAARRLSETALMQDVQVTFARPDSSTRRFVWIHLPFTNPAWVKKIIETLEVQEKREFGELLGREHWESKHTRGRHSQHHAYFVKPTCNFIAPKPMSPRPMSPKASLHSLTDPSMYHYLFLPFLHFDSYVNLIRRREIIKARMRQGRTRPVPQTVAKLESLELQVIWEYLGHDPPINCRRTLDQYGYPSLHDTRARDDDQMLYKMTKEQIFPEHVDPDMYRNQGAGGGVGADGRSYTMQSLLGDGDSVVEVMHDEDEDDEDMLESDEEEDVLNGNVLMVDQLWMWTIDTTTLLTFFPRRESQPTEGPLFQQADLRDSIFNEVNADLTRKCENAMDLAALTALHAVTVLIDRSSHRDLEIFRIFEEAISILTERLTSSLKDFRAQGFRDKALDYDAVENKARSIRARHKEEGKRAEKENRDNTSALLELRDIEDELSTLLGLFDRQEKTIETMKANYLRPELRDATVNGRFFLDEALERLAAYRYQAAEMIQRVRSTRDDYDKLLQMVQRQAQVDEVRLSRLQADLASAQSRSVMIFTTFTVIFLPLTFFTGLFGMNTREWSGGDYPTLQTIGAIALPTSILLIVTALVVAWSTRARRLLRWASRRYAKAMQHMRLTWGARARRWREDRLLRRRRKNTISARQRRTLTRGERERAKAKHEEKAVRREKKRLKKEPSHDFWERHRIEREHEYRVPAMNRKSVSRRRAMAKARLAREMEQETETWRSRKGVPTI